MKDWETELVHIMIDDKPESEEPALAACLAMPLHCPTWGSEDALVAEAGGRRGQKTRCCRTEALEPKSASQQRRLQQS